MLFRATAYNVKGYRFQFTFSNVNWNDIDSVAALNLDAIVAQDSLHKANGPWSYRDIDVQDI